jgi:hypothetical protein
MQIRWFIVLSLALSACGEPVAQKGAKGDQGPPGPAGLPDLLGLWDPARSFVSSTDSVARPARLRARRMSVSSTLTPSSREAPSSSRTEIELLSDQSNRGLQSKSALPVSANEDCDEIQFK